VIVVVGNPRARQSEKGIVASGVAAAVGRVAVAAGAEAQLVGKVGEGPTGDSILLSLAQDGVGHAAVLRDASAPTAVASAATDAEAVLDPIDADDELAAPAEAPATRPLDSGDLQLALRYLPDYRVVVVADTFDEASLGTIVAAARWAGAQLIVVVPAGSTGSGVPDDATILEAPSADADGAFAAVVGAYAAALDRGAKPADAFASASIGSGWSAVID
jgi:sugar/nucleoside kinase (ribokinase family)